MTTQQTPTAAAFTLCNGLGKGIISFGFQKATAQQQTLGNILVRHKVHTLQADGGGFRKVEF